VVHEHVVTAADAPSADGHLRSTVTHNPVDSGSQQQQLASGDSNKNSLHLNFNEKSFRKPQVDARKIDSPGPVGNVSLLVLMKCV
jgi:hypothetical protein